MPACLQPLTRAACPFSSPRVRHRCRRCRRSSRSSSHRRRADERNASRHRPLLPFHPHVATASLSFALFTPLGEVPDLVQGLSSGRPCSVLRRRGHAALHVLIPALPRLLGAPIDLASTPMAGRPPRSSSHPLPVLLQPDGQLDAAKAMFASSLHLVPPISPLAPASSLLLKASS